jgi:hypothetical protein
MPARKPPTNTYWTIRHNWNGELWPRLWPSEESAWKALAKETGFTRAEVAEKCNWSMVQVKVSLVAEVVPEDAPLIIPTATAGKAIPAELAQFGGILDAFNCTLPCGVYFLYLKGALQYIGQSLDPSARIAQHRSQGKVFDHVFVLPTPAFMLGQVEGVMIRKFKPPLNLAVAIHKGESDDETIAWLRNPTPMIEECND